MAIIVKYNGSGMSPTPLVSRNYEFIDFGTRWGQTEQINLSCVVSGLTTPQAAILGLGQLFTGQFKTLEVYDEFTKIYSWPNVCVQEISIPTTDFYQKSVAKYDVKLISYQVPSGVIEPANEYAFSESQDGIVTVNHRISAKGVRTSAGALDNAIAFVKMFVNKNPYNSCAPIFIPNGSGILMSMSETIDRANGSYAVNETYKFLTGSTQPYIETSSLSIDENKSNDYINLDLNVKWQGSPVFNNIAQLQTSASSFNSLDTLKSFGVSTTNVFQDDFSVSIDSGSATLDIKVNFISGVNSDLSGFFDYAVSMDTDEVSDETTWKIEGEYRSRGPISFRKVQIAAFKSANQTSSYVPYLVGLITSSQLFINYGSLFGINGNAIQVLVNENTGLGTLKLSATFSDKFTFGTFAKTNYTIEVEPSRWIYELLPSANIEGHYVVQDLQMRNQAKLKFDVNAQITGFNSKHFTDLSTIASSLGAVYMITGFLTSESTASGLYDISLSQSYLGSEKMGSGLINSKIYGSASTDYFRPAGFRFGY